MCNIFLSTCDDEPIPSILGVAPQISKRWAHLLTDESLWHRIGAHLGAITDQDESPSPPHPTWRSHVIDHLVWDRRFAHELRTRGKRVETPADRSYDFLGKALLSGSKAVGKTSLLEALRGKFKAQYRPTIGIDFELHHYLCDHRNLKLQFWDTAGDPRFMTLAPTFARGSHCFLLVFDLTSRPSFEAIPEHIERVTVASTIDNPAFLLIGTHLDECRGKRGSREVTTREARAFAAQRGMPYVETSACTGHNVDLVFLYAATSVITHENDHCCY